MVSCPSGTHLLSCGSQTTSYSGGDVRQRKVIPVNSTTCQCYDGNGVTCFAWCTTLRVKNFQIVTYYSVQNFQVNCPPGTLVLGCHLSPASTSVDGYRYLSTYPSPNGQSCFCYASRGGDCIATCASNLENYEVSLTTGTGTLISACNRPGNVALGVGYLSRLVNSAYIDCQFGQIQDWTSCSCHFAGFIDCFCICGKLSQ